jgi:hypothetical protein
MHDDNELIVGPRDRAAVAVAVAEPDSREACGGFTSFRNAASSVDELNILTGSAHLFAHATRRSSLRSGRDSSMGCLRSASLP